MLREAGQGGSSESLRARAARLWRPDRGRCNSPHAVGDPLPQRCLQKLRNGNPPRLGWAGCGRFGLQRFARRSVSVLCGLDDGDLAIRDLVTGNARHLTNNTESGGNAFFSAISPDGKNVAYEWYTGSFAADLRLVGLDGSAPRVLFSNKEVGALPTDWSPDGKYVLSILVRINPFRCQIALISVADGSVRVLKTFDRMYPGKMRFSPDGRYIAYDYPPHEESDNRDIFLLAADGSREIPLIEHPAED